MKISDFLHWLDSYLNFEKQQKKGIFWLESMRFLCGRLGNPQNAVPCIHVAGSKGKGSVSKMTACILEAAGYSCGLYTSPHIADFRERIGTANGFFPDEIYENAADELYQCVHGMVHDMLPGGRQFTWFELVTAFAFLCFRNAGVDYAVYETGLGGRLDSTNVVVPEVSVLMAIEREHTEFLGSTVEKIAAEKAGIIKQGVPVVVGRQNYRTAEEIFREKAEKDKCMYNNVYGIIKNLRFSYTATHLMDVSFDCTEFDRAVHAQMQFLGEEQAWNAATAAVAAKIAVRSVSAAQVESGLSKAVLPGRFEIRTPPLFFKGVQAVVLDGAHTVSSVFYTIKTAEAVFSGKQFGLLFACAADKAVSEIVPLFKGKCRFVVLTRPGTVRASDISSLEHCFSENGIAFRTEADCQKAVKEALAEADKKNAVLLVIGSFYLVSEAAAVLSAL